jgi:hypothetical protein
MCKKQGCQVYIITSAAFVDLVIGLCLKNKNGHRDFVLIWFDLQLKSGALCSCVKSVSCILTLTRGLYG